MEEREKRIIRFLASKDSLINKELRDKTKKILGLQSQTSLSKCLRNLEKEGIIKHLKKDYFLNMHKSEKKYYDFFKKRASKLEKEVKDLEKSPDLFGDGYLLLLQIFREWYVPLSYDHIVDRYKKNSIQGIRQKTSLERCKDLIHDIISMMESKDKRMASNVITAIDMTHIKNKKII